MLTTSGQKNGPWNKSDLHTGDILLDGIRGLYRCEENSWTDANARFDRETKERYSHDEIYGNFWSISEFINVPMEFAFLYLANIYSLEEWSYGLRDLMHIGNGIYKGQERWAKSTDVFIKNEVHSEAKTIDYHYAWDEKEELWVRHYFRLIDAQPALNRPGTIMSWFSWKHPYYDKRSPGLPLWLKDAHGKTNRPWYGDFWRYFRAWHKIEADNLRYILEHRYRHKK